MYLYSASFDHRMTLSALLTIFSLSDCQKKIKLPTMQLENLLYVYCDCHLFPFLNLLLKSLILCFTAHGQGWRCWVPRRKRVQDPWTYLCSRSRGNHICNGEGLNDTIVLPNPFVIWKKKFSPPIPQKKTPTPQHHQHSVNVLFLNTVPLSVAETNLYFAAYFLFIAEEPDSIRGRAYGDLKHASKICQDRAREGNHCEPHSMDETG